MKPLVYSPLLVKKILEFDICHFVSGYYIMYKVPDLFDYCVSKIHNKNTNSYKVGWRKL